MRKSAAKITAAGLSIALGTGGILPGAGTAYAETVNDPVHDFCLLDSVTGEPVDTAAGVTVQVYTDASREEMLVGSTTISDNVVSFSVEGGVDDETPYYYGIKAEGYEWAYGGPFRFDENVENLEVTPDHPGAVSFTETAGTLLGEDDITFSDADDKPMTFVMSDDGVLFEDAQIGDTVKFRITKTGYAPLEGTFTLTANMQVMEVTLTEKKLPWAEDTTIHATYGDEDIDIADILALPEDYKGGIGIKILDGDCVTAGEGNALHIVKAGEARAEIRTEETELYKEERAVVSVYIGKKDIGRINSENIVWEGAEKVYDGNAIFAMTGTYKLPDDELQFTANGQADDVHAGTYNAKLSDITVAGGDNYTFDLSDVTHANVVITPKPMHLSLGGISVVYGSGDWEAIREGRLPEGTDLKKIIAKTDEDIPDVALEAVVLSGHVSVAPISGKYLCGKHQDALQMTVTDDKAGDYVLECVDKNGDINVDKETLTDAKAWEQVELDTESGSYVYRDDKAIYVRPGGNVVLRTKADSLYDKTETREEAPVKEESFTGSLLIPDYAQSGSVTGSYMLSRTDSPETRPVPENGDAFPIPENAVIIDADYPQVDFTDGIGVYHADEVGGNKAIDPLTFGVIRRLAGYTVTVQAKDDLSGVKDISYALVGVRNDDAAKEAVQAAVGNQDMAWKPLPKDGNIDIPGTAGYYIALVKVSDNVGNEAVYATNGMCFDTTQPAITLKDLDSGVLYNKDVEYQILLEDPVAEDGVQSGIASVEVTVECDGKKVDGENGTDSFTLDAEGISGLKSAPDSFEGFRKASETKVLPAKITASKCSSNDVKVTVVTEDFAGNVYTASKQIRIDSAAPMITLDMDDSDAQNGYYYNKEKSFDITIRERGFDDSETYLEYNAGDGDVSVSFRDLLAGKAEKDGITAELVSDSEAGAANDAHTDKRELRYKVTLGTQSDADITYDSISVTSFDLAGNAVTASDQKLSRVVIDKIAPICGMVYTADGEDITEDILNAKNEPYYSAKDITASLRVTESHFTNGSIRFTLTEKDGNGKDISVYDKTSLDKASEEDWEKDGDAYIFTPAAFSEDGRYSLTYEITDLAGNRAQVTAAPQFVIDKTMPGARLALRSGDSELANVTDVTGEQLTEKEREKEFTIFTSEETVLDLTTEDGLSGIRRVQYCIADITDQGHSFMAEADLESLPWKEWNGPVTLPEGACAFIYGRVTDKAGNVSCIMPDGGLVIDRKAPGQPGIDDGNIKLPADGDISVSIRAAESDPDGQKNFSGIKTFSYELTNMETGEVTVRKVISPGASRIPSAEDTFVIPAVKNNSNALRLKVTAEDWCGNISQTEKTYMIDTAAPVITTTFDDSDVRNGRYYNVTKTMGVEIQERNYDAEKTILSLKVNGREEAYTFDELMDGKAESSGIRLRLKGDTQSGRETEGFTDARKLSYEIEFGFTGNADCDYADVAVESTDTAGNRAKTAEAKAASFTIDKIAPSADILFLENGLDVSGRLGGNENSPYYLSGDMTVRLNVKERNFSAKHVQLDFTQKNSNGSEVSVYPAASVSAVTTGEWNDQDGLHTFIMDRFTRDARYGIGMTVTDLAGNTSDVVMKRYFTLDRTAPAASMEVRTSLTGRIFNRLASLVRFGLFDNRPVSVSGSASDDVSGVASVEYYIDHPGLHTAGEFRTLGVQALQGVSWMPWNGPLKVTPDEQAVLYMKVTDRAGNVTYVNSEEGVIADAAAPDDVSIVIGGSDAPAVWNKNVPVSVHVSDRISGNTYAGLKQVVTEVLSGGSVTQTVVQDFTDPAGRTLEYDTDLTIDAAKNNSNNVTVRVTASDYAGNTWTTQEQTAIDITAPAISVTYDKNDPANGKYYAEARTATIEVRERNFDPDKVELDIRSEHGNRPQVSGWSRSTSADTDDTVYTCTIVYAEDDDYTFTMKVTDKAGNETEYGRTDSFTIDRTAPVIDVVFDSASENGFYNTPRSASVTITEHNFDAQLAQAQVKAALQGVGIQAPDMIGWTHDGDRHTAVIIFADDGEYRFTVNAADLAGNTAKEYASDPFIVDRTMPTVDITGVKDGSANRGAVAMTVTMKDLNFDPARVEVLLSGVFHKERDLTSYFEAGENGGTISIPDLEPVPENDDIYTLTVRVTDKSGNVTEKQVVFSVNRFGSTYSFDEATEDYLKAYYHKDGAALTIFETNIDELHSRKVSILHNGVTKELDKNLYTVSEVKGEKGRHTYRYMIDSKAFQEEGPYEIIIESEDSAGNMQNNKLKERPVAFLVDRTAPGAVITGVEDGGIYNAKERVITVVVNDNVQVGSLELYVGDKLAASFSGKEIGEAGGKVEYTLSEDSKWQEIYAVAYDEAGNEIMTDKIRVLLTTSSGARFIGSRTAKGIAGAVAAAGAGLIAVIAAKKKKKGDKGQA